MKQTLIATFIMLFFTTCTGDQNNSKTNKQTYVISESPGKNDFLNLTDHEKKVDSIFAFYDKSVDSLLLKDDKVKENPLLQKRSFINNRGRIYLKAFENGKSATVDSAFYTGMPAPCECLVKDDTVFVNMGIGFFGGMAFNIVITKSDFQSYYYLYIDDVKPYKASLKDSFSNELTVKSKFQHLIIDHKPTFQEGQQLSGYLTMTSASYYEYSYGQKLDTNYVSGKVYFTCTTKKKFE
jgi:hypothetical protein